MIIKYFSWIREIAEVSEEKLNLPPAVKNVNELINYLSKNDEKYKNIFKKRSLIKVAVNKTYASPSTSIKDTDEIAFFPPVTGG